MKRTLVFLVALLVGPLAALHAAGTSKPNVLFIITDQQHAGMLSCTGNPYVRTPVRGSGPFNFGVCRGSVHGNLCSH